MRHPRLLILLANYLSLHLILLTSSGQVAQASEIHVILLGQPCLLAGPFDNTTLELVHSVGPAQIYPNFTNLNQPGTRDQVSRALLKSQNAKKLPNLLERYRERLTSRLQRQLRFIQALQGQSKIDALLKLGRGAIQGPEIKKFESILKPKRGPEEENTVRPEAAEQLFELYTDAIEPDPESEFHRAIKKLQIQYNCSFEESEPESPNSQKR